MQAQRTRESSSAIGLRMLSVLLMGLADGRKAEDGRPRCSVCGAYCHEDACYRDYEELEDTDAPLVGDLSRLCPFINDEWHRFAERIMTRRNLKNPETAAILLYLLLKLNERKVREHNDSVDEIRVI